MKRTMKRVAILLLLLGITLGVTASVKPKEATAAGWTWSCYTYTYYEGDVQVKDIWMRAWYNGVGLYDFRLGPGGCIDMMRWVPASCRPLISPTSVGEHVDRVVQWCFWSDELLDPHAGLANQQNWFNINQAGSHGRDIPADGFVAANEIFTPTMSVVINGSTVDVYSVPQDPWWQAHVPNQAGKIASLTRYEMQSLGTLKVRRVIRTCEATSPNHDPDDPYDLRFEAWTPFKKSADTFTAIALEMNASGQPVNPAYSGNITSNQLMSSTNGYAVVFNGQNPYSMPAVGFVFGNDTPVRYTGSGGNAWLNVHEWDTGICPIPVLKVYDCPPGSIVDQTYFIVARPVCCVSLRNMVVNLASQVPPMTIYGPDYDYDDQDPTEDELLDILDDFDDILNTNPTAAMRTRHLGNLLD